MTVTVNIDKKMSAP